MVQILYPEGGAVYQHDNAPVHTARLVTEWFCNLEIYCLIHYIGFSLIHFVLKREEEELRNCEVDVKPLISYLECFHAFSCVLRRVIIMC